MRSADRASWLAEDPAEICPSILGLKSPVLFGSGSIDPRIYRLSSGGSGGGGSRVHPVAELGHGGVSTSPTVAPTKRWMQMGPTIEPSLDEVHRHTRMGACFPSIGGSPGKPRGGGGKGRMHAFLRLPSTFVPWDRLGGSRTTRSTRHRKEGRRPEPLQKKNLLSWLPPGETVHQLHVVPDWTTPISLPKPDTRTQARFQRETRTERRPERFKGTKGRMPPFETGRTRFDRVEVGTSDRSRRGSPLVA